MKTPIQLLTDRREEIRSQLKLVLDQKYHKKARSKDSTIEEFNINKEVTRARLKEQDDEYTEAINSLQAIKNMTF